MRKIVTLLCILATPFLFISCQKEDSSNVLKIAATSVPHAEILEFIQPSLKEKGFESQIIVVEDYNIPNRALNDGEVDANFFQHVPFLEMQCREFGYQLQSFSKVHIEPMALYSKQLKMVADLPNGAVVAIPSDATNQARALLLLEKVGLLQLNRHDAITSLHNLISNSKQLQFVESDAALLSRTLDDVDLAAIPTNFALQAGLMPQEALAMESSDSLFTNILVIRKGDEKRPSLIALKELLCSEAVDHYIESHYQGAISSAQKGQDSNP